MDKGHWYEWKIRLDTPEVKVWELRDQVNAEMVANITHRENTTAFSTNSEFATGNVLLPMFQERFKMIAAKLRELSEADNPATEPTPDTIEVRVAVAVGSDGSWLADEDCSKNGWRSTELGARSCYLSAFESEAEAVHTIVAQVPRPKPEPSLVIEGRVE